MWGILGYEDPKEKVGGSKESPTDWFESPGTWSLMKQDHEKVVSREVYEKLLFFWVHIQETDEVTEVAIGQQGQQSGRRAGKCRREKTTWDVPIPLWLSVPTIQHDKLGEHCLLLHFHLPNIIQVSFLASSNLVQERFLRNGIPKLSKLTKESSHTGRKNKHFFQKL